MGTRRAARELALQALYQVDLLGDGEEPRRSGRSSGRTSTGAEPEAREPSRASWSTGVAAHRERIDALIAATAEHWRLARLSRVDLSLLRVGDVRAHRPARHPGVGHDRRGGRDRAPLRERGLGRVRERRARPHRATVLGATERGRARSRAGWRRRGRAARYDPQAVETKWQRRWAESRAFAAPSSTPGRPPYYVLEMFPYPSGRIHMGHVRNYTIGDVIARQRRMRGFHVLHPMGWDAFGLPAENAAIKHGMHPARWTDENIAHMRRQLRRLGFSYDWDREVATCDPTYYRWEQLFFLRMLERGLAYKRNALVNWCPRCQTVLANEQVDDGRCWRCDGPVEQRELEQWFFRITAYAEELLADLDRLDGLAGARPHHAAELDRTQRGRGDPLSARRTPGRDRGVHDAARHALRRDVRRASRRASAGERAGARAPARRPSVAAFAARARATARSERHDGQGGGADGRLLPPSAHRRAPADLVANFVLMDYGTGAVMAVPAHDQRDFEFAHTYGLPIRVVIQPAGERLDPDGDGRCMGRARQAGRTRATSTVSRTRRRRSASPAALAARGLGEARP